MRATYTADERIQLADALERLLPDVIAALRDGIKVPCTDRLPQPGETIEAPSCESGQGN